MIDVLDAPFPYVIGIQSQVLSEAYKDIPDDVLQVNLDGNNIYNPEPSSKKVMPSYFKRFREKLIKATMCIKKRPDPSLEHIDQAFQYLPMMDDEEEDSIDEY